MTHPDRHANSPSQFQHPALAVILGWLLPGAGHILLGQRTRGLRVMAGILGLVCVGVLIGGVDAVDSVRDKLWYMAQLGAGPIVILVDALNQQVARTLPQPEQFHTMGLGHINAIGTLYIALAGLMNIVALLDLLRARKPEAPARRAQDATAGRISN
jgi:TM2 domain-containing membrane protein YozV